MASPPRRVNQRDIARRVGVSQAVVSFVLNGRADQHRVSPETQDRVRAAIAELDYLPDVAGRSLRRGRNDLIGVHTYESIFPVRAGDYYHDFLVGIEAGAVALQKDLVLFASAEQENGTRSIYRNGNRLRLVDGTLILGVRQNSEELVRLAAEGVPFVFIGRRNIPRAQAPYVTADYESAVKDVVRRLSDLGHRNMAYIGHALHQDALTERRDAFRTAAAASSWSIASETFIEPTELDESVVQGLLTSDATAVLLESPHHLEAFQAALRTLGASAPFDLSVATLDTLPDSASTWSHTRLPKEEMGRESMRLLLDLIDGEIPHSQHVVLPCSFNDRGSIGEPPTMRKSPGPHPRG